MKKLSSRFLITILLSTSLSNISWGQDKTDFKTSRFIELKSESEEQKIVLSVTDKYNYLIISISSTIEEGDLTMEIYDPLGEKQGNFSAGCQLYFTKSDKNDIKSDKVGDSQKPKLNKSKEVVRGTITRSITYPTKGDWVVKIIPKKTSGIITMEVTQKDLEKIKD